jgi:DNA-binding transcriptional LysR family regulator
MQPNEANIRHLALLAAIARTGSISSAALAVNLSQPAAAQGLSKLERGLGVRLFDRQPDGVRPTRAGELMLPRAERAIAIIADAARLVRRSARLPAIPHAERLMTMVQLRAFQSTVRHASYAAAGREIGLSQPSVYRSARELELILQVPLLVRVGKSVRATEPAERLARAVSLCLAELQYGFDELRAMTGGGPGRLIVGALPLPRSALLPEALARFSAAQPKAEIKLVEGPYVELAADLREGSIDLLLGALRDPSACPDLAQTRLFADALYAVARADHPLAGREATIERLRSFPWIVAAPGAPMRRIWDHMFEGVEQPEAMIECGSILTARGLLLNGDWIVLMSTDQFRIERNAGLLDTIGGPVPGSRRDIGLATRLDFLPTAAQAEFIAIVKDVAARR